MTSSYDDDAMLSGDMAPAYDGGSTTIAAAFGDREQAHDAAHRLHDEGFRESWIGITRSDDSQEYRATPDDRSPAGNDRLSAASGETRVEADNWFMRFFAEGDESLHDALVQHGVSEADARAVGDLPAHSAILTVDGANDPQLAEQIISQSGGRLITRGAAVAAYRGPMSGDTGRAASEGYGISEAPEARTTSLYDEGKAENVAAGERSFAPSVPPSDTELPGATAYDDYGRSSAGTPIDESTRLQLRAERLRIDKSRVSRGEATVGTEVVTETHNVDVPLVREELFVERRPVSGSSVANDAPIGSNEVVRVPLSEEHVTITKVPIVTEEVIVGKRAVESVAHVSETTRKEQLTTNGVDTPAATDSPVGASRANDPRP